MGVSRARLENLLASLSLALADDGTRAVEEASGLGGSGPAAVLALGEFLGGANLGRLADVLGISHSGAVRLVAQLEAGGLVRRRPGRDRREITVALTAKGRRLASRLAATRRSLVAQAVSGLDEGEAADLERLLEAVVATRVGERVRRRVEDGVAGPWWCRMCDMAACGRPEGRCPAQATVADHHA